MIQDKVRKLHKAARTQGIMISVAESCTGGMVAAALTAPAGASAVFGCGFVTYSNEAKRSLLGVRNETLSQFGAVSQEVALEMAYGACARGTGQLSVAITGIAGPGASEFKPEGRVCFARAGRKNDATTVEFGPLGRDKVRLAARDYAIELLLSAL